MPDCEFVTFISILACNIAKDKTPEELATLSAFFVQLRRHASHNRKFEVIMGASSEIVILGEDGDFGRCPLIHQNC